MSTADHPVWAVYDRLRTARLTVKYYCAILLRWERISFWLDIVLLAAAPGSALAALWFWDTGLGREAWKAVSVVAALVAIAKPTLNPTRKIKELESALAGYRGLEFDLLEIKIGVEQKRRYDAALQADFRRALQRERALVTKDPVIRQDAKLKSELEDEVIRELPVDAFFVPEEHA